MRTIEEWARELTTRLKGNEAAYAIILEALEGFFSESMGRAHTTVKRTWPRRPRLKLTDD